MKFLGVPGVFDYAGLNKDSRYRPCSCGLPHIFTASASGLYIFAAQCPTPPILYLRFAGSLAVAAQDSRPSGSLLLSCKALSSSPSHRFIPAHKYLYYAQNPLAVAARPSLRANRRRKLALNVCDRCFVVPSEHKGESSKGCAVNSSRDPLTLLSSRQSSRSSFPLLAACRPRRHAPGASHGQSGV
jgi:hypothetical protein